MCVSKVPTDGLAKRLGALCLSLPNSGADRLLALLWLQAAGCRQRAGLDDSLSHYGQRSFTARKDGWL